jgi:hypothetical protein
MLSVESLYENYKDRFSNIISQSSLICGPSIRRHTCAEHHSVSPYLHTKKCRQLWGRDCAVTSWQPVYLQHNYDR